MSTPRLLALVVTPALLAVGATAQTPAPPASQPTRLRQEMDAVAAALDAAVAKVSPTHVLTRVGARGYRLDGYGAVFVLTPRVLPVRRRPASAPQQAASDMAAAVRQLERSLGRVQTQDMRDQIQAQLKALRATQAALRAQGGAPGTAATVHGSVSIHFQASSLEDLERQVEQYLAEQTRGLQQAQRAHALQDDAWRADFEAQARAMHEIADAFAREAERAFEQREREIRVQLSPLAESPQPAAQNPSVPVSSAPPASTGVAPAPPDDALGEPALTPGDWLAGAAGPPLAPPPPWRLWVESEEEADTRAPETVFGDVKKAVANALEIQGPRLRGLASEETVVVAVDFVPSGRSLRSRPARTLVARVAKKELDARQAGRIDADEFRRRIEFTEY